MITTETALEAEVVSSGQQSLKGTATRAGIAPSPIRSTFPTTVQQSFELYNSKQKKYGNGDRRHPGLQVGRHGLAVQAVGLPDISSPFAVEPQELFKRIKDAQSFG